METDSPNCQKAGTGEQGTEEDQEGKKKSPLCALLHSKPVSVKSR